MNRGDYTSRRVHCLTCYNAFFPDAVALLNQQRQLEAWLAEVLRNPNSQGPWKEPLRGFLEAGRQFLTVTSTATPTPPVAMAAPVAAAVPHTAVTTQAKPAEASPP